MSICSIAPVDRERFPLTCELREALCAVSEKAIAEYETGLKAAGSKTEKRALSISLNMARLSETFLCFHARGGPVEVQTALRRKRLESGGVLEEYIGNRAAFDALSQDEAAEWFQFADAVFMLRRAFLDPHLAKITAAREDPSVRGAEQVFESRIVLGTLCAILREWRAIRSGRGLFPLDLRPREEEPWDDMEESGPEGEE